MTACEPEQQLVTAETVAALARIVGAFFFPTHVERKIFDGISTVFSRNFNETQAALPLETRGSVWEAFVGVQRQAL